MSTIPLNSKLLKELLNSTNLTAKLFINDLLDCEDIPSSIEFEEASFIGYSPKFLNPLLWEPMNQAPASYTKYKYKNGIIWKNLGQTVNIKGYYVTNKENQVLWFEKFDNEIILNQNQGTLVNVEVEMNNYDFPKTTITLVVKNDSNLIPENISVSIENIKWGGVDYSDSLLDLLNNNFIPHNNMVCIGVRDSIKPCSEEPLQFDLTISASGFETYQENISVTNPGNSILEIYLDQVIVTTTVAPPIVIDTFRGLLSIKILDDIYDINTSSTSDKISIKVYKPASDQLQNLIINDISFNLTGNADLLTNDFLPSQLKNSENFTKMSGSFSFFGGSSGSFTTTSIITIPSQNGNTTFFSGTMNEDSILGRWVAGDVFSAELTFSNSDLLGDVNEIITQVDNSLNALGPSGATHYLLLNSFNFVVSGITYSSDNQNLPLPPCPDGGPRRPLNIPPEWAEPGQEGECCPPARGWGDWQPGDPWPDPSEGKIPGYGNFPPGEVSVKGFGYSECMGRCVYCNYLNELGSAVWDESECKCKCVPNPDSPDCKKILNKNYKQDDYCMCVCPKNEIKEKCESKGFKFDIGNCACDCDSTVYAPGASNAVRKEDCPKVGGKPLWDDLDCYCPCDEAKDASGKPRFPPCKENEKRGKDCKCEALPPECPDMCEWIWRIPYIGFAHWESTAGSLGTDRMTCFLAGCDCEPPSYSGTANLEVGLSNCYQRS